MIRSLLLRTGLASVLAASALASGQVWVVDVAGHGDFAEVQPAIDRAAPGDTILVRGPADPARRYEPFTVDRALTLIGLAPEPVFVEEVRIAGVPATGYVVLANFGVRAQLPTGPYQTGDFEAGIEIEDCAGVVWLESCVIRGGLFPGGPAARITRSDVVISDSSLTGGWFGATSTGHFHGSHGVLVAESRLALYASRIQGGASGNFEGFEDIIAGDGGDGVRAGAHSLVWVEDCEVRGGEGGSAATLPFAQSFGGDGGTGLAIGPDSAAFLRASLAQGGVGGTADNGDGEDGPGLFGPVTPVDGSALALAAPEWLRDVDAPPFTTTGEPATPATLLVADRASWFSLGAAGVVHARPAGAAGIVPLGDLPASGSLAFQFTSAAVAPSAARTLFVQTLHLEPGGRALGAPRAVVVLDERFLPTHPPRIHVDAAAAPGGDGSTWLSAFADLRMALEAVAGVGPVAGEDPFPAEVWVRAGTYKAAPPGGDRHRTFSVKSGTQLYGGFAGHETDLAQRDLAAHTTTLCGDLDGDDGPGQTHMGENSLRLLGVGEWLPRRGVRIDGLTLRQGNSEIPGTQLYTGSAIQARGQLDVANCVIADNREGNALHIAEPELRVFNTRFLGNWTDILGGACRLGNFFNEGSALFVGCEFSGNRGRRGGAAFVQVPTTFAGCSFYGNVTVLGEGGALAVHSPGVSIAGSAFWSNEAVHPGTDDFGPLTTQFAVDWSLFENGATSGLGVGNVSGPPGFRDPDGADDVPGTPDDDLRPRPGSPLIDAGSNPAMPADVLDLDGDGDVAEPVPLDVFRRPRFVDDPAMPDMGDGRAPLVDIGANEKP